MATANHGWAQLDLDGNRITWDPSDTKHHLILLDGSHFHDIVPMATLAISCLCLLSFFAILLAVCVIYCGPRGASKFLPWHSVWVPVFCMIGYFASDITNRIFHELQRTEPWEYIGVNIVIGSLASIADGLLLVYLLKISPVKVVRTGHIGGLVMILAIVVYWIIGTASKGTQIWNLVVQNSVNTGSDSDDTITKSLNIFQDLDTVASGMLLLFAIGFAILARSYLNDLSEGETLRKRLSFAVVLLAAAFLVRNAVKFAFALVYSQLNKTASLHIQLTYMATYGLLSVVIFACIVSIAALEVKKNTVSTPTHGQATQMVATDPEDASYEYEAKSGVMADAYPTTQGYSSYRYQT